MRRDAPLSKLRNPENAAVAGVKSYVSPWPTKSPGSLTIRSRVTGLADTVSVPSSSTAYASATAFGASLTGVTVIDTPPLLDAPAGSDTLNTNASGRLESAAGVYVNVPSALNGRVPWSGP